MRVDIEHDGELACYIDIVSHDHSAELKGVEQELSVSLPDDFAQRGHFYKDCTLAQPVRDAAKLSAFSFFPSFRCESPAWLFHSESPALAMRERYHGVSTTSVIKVDIIKEVEPWLLDLVLDRELYEHQRAPSEEGRLSLGYRGRNTALINLVNVLLRTIYEAKDSSIEGARIGVSSRGNRRIEIILTRTGSLSEITISPRFSHLSSGEVALLSLFVHILKDYDAGNPGHTMDLKEVRGIVIVDEADLHLHLKLQKEAVPRLIRMLPGVQFIFTTHSPFLMMGLQEQFVDVAEIFELPRGALTDVYDFGEFRDAYETFVSANERFKARYEQVAAALQGAQQLLILTEGKTDWMHPENALSWHREKGQFKDLNIGFLRYDADMGDQALLAMVRTLSKIPRQQKVIGVFDRDNESILGEASCDGGAKHWGNNVYSFCVPVPPRRRPYRRISLEFYYSDDEVRARDPQSGKRLHFSNEVQEVVTIDPTKKGVQKVVKSLQAARQDDELDKYVYDRDCDHIVDDHGERCALSKTAFAEKVLKREVEFDGFDLSNFGLIFSQISCVAKEGAS